MAAHLSSCLRFFFFNDTATTEIYTLSLHDALPIPQRPAWPRAARALGPPAPPSGRSEEHTSELQSHSELVCRLLLEKKKHTISFAKTISANKHHVTKSRPSTSH